MERYSTAELYKKKHEQQSKLICRARYPVNDKVYCLLDWEVCNPHQKKCRGIEGR